MADNTGISWSNATWNYFRGCSRVSAGCTRCYAETMASRFAGPGQPYEGTIRNGRWNGHVREIPTSLDQPLRWARPRLIFANSMSDAFHESLPSLAIARMFAVMAVAQHHQFQVLTKRPRRAERWFGLLGIAEVVKELAQEQAAKRRSTSGWTWPGWPLPNVWLGVSVEDQEVVDRIDVLRALPAAIRFLSCEPLLEALTLRGRLDGIHWAILGGESGTGARPCDVHWIRSAIDVCDANDVAIWVKQLGAHSIGWDGTSQQTATRSRKGDDPAEWPDDLRRQAMPTAIQPWLAAQAMAAQVVR